MKAHTDLGHTILKHSQRDILKAGMVIAYQHHEKYNGSGYPKGLIGQEIHIFARIVTLVDVFDALTAKRCYKEPWPLDKVIEHIKSQRGKHFDPILVDLFLEHIDEFYAIVVKHHG